MVLLVSSAEPQRALQETKAALRKEGFKTELSDFNFSVPSDQRRFESFIRTPQFGAGMTPSALDLMVRVSSKSALVIWKDDLVRTRSEQLTWADFEEETAAMEPTLLSARDEALAGSIQFNLDATRGSSMLLPHLGMLNRLGAGFSAELILDLHRQDPHDAWTNLLATTHLATAWQPEPVEISHIVRFGLTGIAFNATWQAVQAGGWSDAQLAQLQKEWDSVDFFKDLPEVAAFQRVCMVDTCERMRGERMPSMGIGGSWKMMVRSPGTTARILKNWWDMSRYRREGIYEDEKAALLFYRDQEIELQKAIHVPTWEAMRLMPGVTNHSVFTSKFNSPMRSMIQMRMMGGALARPNMTLLKGLLARAAEAETQRRLILTALALERFHLKNGKYPASLQELAPDFMKTAPVDFMDGKPLRYELGDDGRFLLYSTGLDCVDNGGQMSDEPNEDFMVFRPPVRGRMPVSQAAVDLVWPRPASKIEITELHEQELTERRLRLETAAEAESGEYWARTAKRQAGAAKLLASAAAAAHDTNYDRNPLAEELRNTNSVGTNAPGLEELLTLHTVATGDEPEKVTFELPISYDALTNIGSLQLFVDPVRDEDADEPPLAGQATCVRATNGDCLLVWNTIFEAPGKHALMAVVFVNESLRTNSRQDVMGPAFEANVTNLCQFSISSATFDSRTGATLRAILPEKRADYSIDMLAKGERLKTITGSTTDGVMDVFWDLIDDHGQKLHDESFETVVHLEFPDSGRAQTLKGP